MGGAVIDLLEGADAARRGGRLAESRAGYAAAAEAARTAGDDSALVTAALGIGGLWVYEQRQVVDRVRLAELWREVVALTQPGSLESVRLAVRRAAEAVYEGGPVAAVRRAVEEVRSFGDDAATAQALSLLHHVLLGPADAERRLGIAEEIVRLGVRAGEDVLAVQGLCWRTVDLFLAGDSRAGQSHRELSERAEGCEAIGFIADVMSAMLAARAGRLAEAEVLAGAAFTRGVAAGDPDAPAYYGAMLAALRWWQGRAGEMVEIVRATVASPALAANDHVYIAGEALLSATVGDTDAAEEALARLPSDRMALLEASSSWLTMQFLMVEAAYMLGNAAVAVEAASRMEPFAHLPVMPSLAVVCFGSAERSLGLARAVSGDLDEAADHLSAAIEDDRRLGNRPMRALTEHTLAGVVGARGRTGDAARSAQLVAQAGELADRCGVALGSHPEWLKRTWPATARQGATPPRRAVFEAVPGGWRVEVAGRGTMLADRVGLAYLTKLLAHPYREHDVVRLASNGAGPPEWPDAVLDNEAIASYRRRAKSLESSLRAGLSDAARRRAQKELREIASALQATLGLGGRVRRFPDSHERARTSVRKALVRAIESVAAVEPALGDYLRTSIITGSECRYDPSGGWSVEVSARS